ncbi:anaerobic dimethyl sulfoxide reductase subunit C [Enterobacter hormaechei]|nr:anaerobic dimethyl sulfoxide reductase subunit C [Enterobacter hormaechei]
MHELPLLIFTLFLQGSVGVTLWLAFGSTQRSALLPAAGAFVLASLGLLASALHMGCSPPRCTWAIRLMLLTRCATYPAPG